MPDFEKVAFAGRQQVQVVELGVRSCAVESVVVYSDRAEVKRAVPLTLLAGDNEVIIYDLPTSILENSIRVEGKGAATITDVIYSSKERTEKEEAPSGSKEQYQAVKEEIEQCQVELKHLEFREEVLKKEKQLLAKFACHISSIHTIKENDSQSLSQLVDQENVSAVMEFFEKYENKVADLDSRLSSVSRDKATVNEKIAVLQANADKLNPNKKVVSKETIRAVHVGLEAAAEMKVTLFLSYVVTNASWSAAYDARVFTKDKLLKVQYYGLIKQQTGEDWEDTKMSLSTAQPAIGGSAPTLPTKIVRFPRPVLVITGGSMPKPMSLSIQRDSSLESSINYEAEFEDEELEDDLEFNLASNEVPGMAAMMRIAKAPPPPPPKALEIDVAKVDGGLFNATYSIPRTTTIPADNTEHKVTIALVDLSPEFHYNTVPRLSPHSFLQAKAKNASPYTMLAGPANIFLDNNFIAKSELSAVSPNEEFTTSLGVDQSLRITCFPVESVHNTRTGLLGGSKATSIGYTHKFLVKNTKSHTVNIHLSEQVPLSTDDRIKVHIIQPEARKAGVKCVLPYGHAVLNDSNNMEWHISVEAGAEQELKLVYTVEYPAQDSVEGLPKC